MLNWNDYSRYRLATRRPGRVAHDEMVELLLQDKIAGPHANVQLLGKSHMQRDIFIVRRGSRPNSSGAWSQMHGDEPTHTVVLLELLLLLSDTTNPIAQAILKNCQLSMVPMLNPDGAIGWTRHNAQGIDINRDARRRTSPEAQLLWQLIENGRFDFAFNLHNQKRTRTVNGEKLSAVALLVPPVDELHSQTAHVVRAKRLAAALREAVEPRCQGMISRYVAGYMPRCFGENVQAAGVSTLLVEAGACPDRDADWLTKLHFFGLVAALTAIAAQDLDRFAVEDYELLPESEDIDLFDVLVRDVRLQREVSCPTDIGITHQFTPGGGKLTGQVTEIGDLENRYGREHIDAASLVVVPARSAFDTQLRADADDIESRLVAAALVGVTSVLGVFDLSDDHGTQSVGLFPDGRDLLIDVGWVGRIDCSPKDTVRFAEQIRLALQVGVMALTSELQVIAELVDPTGRGDLGPGKLFGLPFLRPQELDEHAIDGNAIHENWNPTAGRRGLQLMQAADFLLVHPDQLDNPVHCFHRGVQIIADRMVLDRRPGIVLQSGLP